MDHIKKILLLLLAAGAALQTKASPLYDKSSLSPVQNVPCTNDSAGAKDVVLLAKAAAAGGTITLQNNCTINASIALISHTKLDGNGYAITGAASSNWASSTVTHFVTTSSATDVTVRDVHFVCPATATGSMHVMHFVGGSKIRVLDNYVEGNNACGDGVAFIGVSDGKMLGNTVTLVTNAPYDNWNGTQDVEIGGNYGSTKNTGTGAVYGILWTGFNTNNTAGTATIHANIHDNKILISNQAAFGDVGIYIQGYATCAAPAASDFVNVHDNQIYVAAGIWGEAIRSDGCSNHNQIHDNTIYSDGVTTANLPAIEVASLSTNVWVHDNHVNNWLGQAAGSDRGVFTNKGTGGSLNNNTCIGTCSTPLDYVGSSTTIQQAGDDTGTGTTTFNSPVAFPSGATGDLIAGAGANIGWIGRGQLTSPNVNQVQLGNTNSATPSAQEIFTQGARGGTDTNVGGGNLTIHSGQGTGTGTVSTTVLDTPLIGSTGTTLQTMVSGLQLGATQIYIGNATSNPAITLRGSGTLSGTPLTNFMASPGPIGSGTPSTGAFTTLTSSSGMALTQLATQATNTVTGNATSGSAVPTALGVGTCSTSASALNWTTNTGFGCNTAVNAAQLGGATFASPGAIGSGTPSTGAFTTLTGQSGHSASITLCEYGSATGTTHTGTTAEFNLAVCTIPANSMGSQGSLRITAHWLRTATTTNTVTLTIRMAAVSGSTSAGITPLASGQATSGVVAIGTTTYVRNTATGAQLMTYSGSGAGVGTATSAPTTGAQDTTATQYIMFNCGDTTSSADTCGIYAYLVELLIP